MSLFTIVSLRRPSWPVQSALTSGLAEGTASGRQRVLYLLLNGLLCHTYALTQHAPSCLRLRSSVCSFPQPHFHLVSRQSTAFAVPLSHSVESHTKMIFGPANKASRRQSHMSLARFVDDSNEQLESEASLRISKKAPRLSLPPSARGSRGQLKITILHDTLVHEPHALASLALASPRPASLAPPPTPITPILTSHRTSTAGLTPTSPNPTTPTSTTPILNGRVANQSPSSPPYTRSERDLTRHVTISEESTACGSDDAHTLVGDSWSLRRSLAKQRKKSVGSLKQVWANVSGRSTEEQREALALLKYISASSADLAPSPMSSTAPSPLLPSLQQDSPPPTDAESPTLPNTMALRPMHPAVPYPTIMPRRSSLHSLRLNMPPPSVPPPIPPIPPPSRPNRHMLSEHPFRMSTATTSLPAVQASLTVAPKKPPANSIPDLVIPDMPPLPPEYAGQNLRTASVCSSPTSPHSIRRKPVPQFYNLDAELAKPLSQKAAPLQRARHPFAASAPLPPSHNQHRRDRAAIDEPCSAPPTTTEFSFDSFATTGSEVTAAVPPPLPPPRHPPPPRPPRRLSQRPISTYLHQSHLSRR